MLKEGHHIWRGSYDKAGNLVEFAYFDEQSRPTTIASGYHKAVCSYDERGRQTRIIYFDTAGNKTRHKDGYHIAATEFEDSGDRKGHRKNRWSYYDIDGNPIENSSSGTHMTLNTFDANGRAIESAYFDRKGKPTVSRFGYHKVKHGFDVAGNRIERSYLGIDDEPAPSLDGISSELATYNENGKQISIAYFGKDDQPITPKDAGLHRVVRSFDLLGRATEETYFGPGGRLVLNGFGVHSKRSQYDSQGNEIQADFFDTSGERVDSVDGYHRRKSTYDKWNRLADQRYFGTSGRPCAESETGAHRVAYRYDPRERRTEVSYFDEKDQPILSHQRYHSRENAYDDRGNLTGFSFFGVNGEPVAPGQPGYHHVRYTLDEKGRALSESYFDAQGQPSHLPQSTIHRAAFANNELGQRIKTEYFQADGSPGAASNGVHKFTQDFDVMGRSIKEDYFSAQNTQSPTVSFAVRRDLHGNIVERAVKNANGAPINLAPDRRVHRTTFRYDDSGHAIEEAYFDVDGQPALGSSGVHKVVRIFDDYGNAVEVLNFDRQGEPAMALGKHRLVFVYNGRNVIKESYFDAKGQPIARNGIWGRQKESGRLAEVDENGKPIPVVSVLTVSSPPFKGGAGDVAGLRAGDIILACENWRFPLDQDDVDWNRAHHGLVDALLAPGTTPRNLVILRDGQLMKLSATPGLLQIRLTSEASSRDWLRAAARGSINSRPSPFSLRTPRPTLPVVAVMRRAPLRNLRICKLAFDGVTKCHCATASPLKEMFHTSLRQPSVARSCTNFASMPLVQNRPLRCSSDTLPSMCHQIASAGTGKTFAPA